MKPKKAQTMVMIMVCIATLISCSQKFPKPLSNEVGILVIATKSTNESKHNFAYKYELTHLPETSAEIKILPSVTSDFTMIAFPVGKYWINGVKTMPVHSGTTIPMSAMQDHAINAGSFEIKPNHITLFNNKFIILNKKITDMQTRQSWKLESLLVREKLDLLNELKKLENSELWNFPD